MAQSSLSPERPSKELKVTQQAEPAALSLPCQSCSHFPAGAPLPTPPLSPNPYLPVVWLEAAQGRSDFRKACGCRVWLRQLEGQMGRGGSRGSDTTAAVLHLLGVYVLARCRASTAKGGPEWGR